jgi:hypothetical protein
MTLGANYVYASIPKITVQGVLPTAIAQINASTFDLTYASSVVATNVVVVPSNDPGIRSVAGGFLNAGTVAL